MPEQFGLADQPEFIQLGSKSDDATYAERSAALVQHRFVVDVRKAMRNEPVDGTRTIASLAAGAGLGGGTLGNYVHGRAWMPMWVLITVTRVLDNVQLLPLITSWEDIDPNVSRVDL